LWKNLKDEEKKKWNDDAQIGAHQWNFIQDHIIRSEKIKDCYEKIIELQIKLENQTDARMIAVIQDPVMLDTYAITNICHWRYFYR
jgi:hypothetical protein